MPIDPWDFDSRHPARGRPALFGTKKFLATLDDGSELLTFFGEVDWREDSEGFTITDIRYWPDNEDMRESVEDWVSMNIF